MTENEIATAVVNSAYDIHSKLGPGLFESVYETLLAYELRKKGLSIDKQRGVPVYWDNLKPKLRVSEKDSCPRGISGRFRGPATSY